MTTAFARSTKLANYLVAAVLVLVPFHALLTIWLSSAVGYYTVLRLWDDVLLLGLLGIVCFWLARDTSLRKDLSKNLVVRLVLLYMILTVLLGFIAFAKGDVTIKAWSYGLLVNLRYLAWFIAIALVAQRSDFLLTRWRQLLLAPAAVVVVFAALQYTVLPHNFLSHFGYNAGTNIAPIETINHNSHYIRVQSTLRGANPLGAYLVIVAAVIGLLWTRTKNKLPYGLVALVSVVALYASGSRSAWIGTFLGLATVIWLRLKTPRAKCLFVGLSLGFVLLFAGTALLLRNNVSFENAVLHTQKNSAVTTGSNSAHASALKSGLEDVVHQPFGDGPGTAGPASEYNGNHAPRIAENYYVQIAQETGWLGLGLFLSIVSLVAVALYKRATQSPLALLLLASLIGISFVCLLSHAWTDDTLAFVWWGLAGIALGRPLELHPKAK